MRNTETTDNNKANTKAKRKHPIDDLIKKNGNNKVMGAVCFLAAALAIWQCIDYLIPARVKVVQQKAGEAIEYEVETRAKTSKEVLSELGLEVSDIDRVLPVEGYGVRNGMTITLTKGLRSTANIAGKDVEFILMPGTVEENLQFNGVSYDGDDIVSPGLSENVTSSTKIELQDVRKEIEEKQETIKSKDIIILDPSYSSGYIEETEGNDGEAIYTYTTTYINGVNKGTAKIVKEWIVEPVDHTYRCGTAATGESGETTYSDSFISESTAYYFGKNATSSTGDICRYGTCAVDPSVIPYWSKLYIEGYGVAIANDTGGALSGTDVDVYMRSEKEAINWGRRNVRVFILD